MHSFTMNRLFFMLDSKYMINILSLHNNDLNLDEINTYSLDFVYAFRQEDKLGCNVSDYAEHIELSRETDYIVYLLMYQCMLKNKFTLKMATMKVYNRTNDTVHDDENIQRSIRNLSGQLDIAVQIADIEIYDFCNITKTFSMVITTNSNSSY